MGAPRQGRIYRRDVWIFPAIGLVHPSHNGYTIDIPSRDDFIPPTEKIKKPKKAVASVGREKKYRKVSKKTNLRVNF
jgi:hypothetical protein